MSKAKKGNHKLRCIICLFGTFPDWHDGACPVLRHFEMLKLKPRLPAGKLD